MQQVSLVEVSPSTDTRLKVTLVTSYSASWSTSGEMAQSVVRKQSMVPMLGWGHAGALCNAAQPNLLAAQLKGNGNFLFLCWWSYWRRQRRRNRRG